MKTRNLVTYGKYKMIDSNIILSHLKPNKTDSFTISMSKLSNTLNLFNSST